MDQRPDKDTSLLATDNGAGSLPRVQPPRTYSNSPTFEGEKFFSELSQEYTTIAWKRLCDRLMGTPVEHIASEQGEVGIAIEQMKLISKTGLHTLEEMLKFFFQNACLYNDALLHSSSMLTEKTHSELMSAAIACHADAQSQIAEKGKHLEALEKKRDDICSQIQQEKETLKSLQSGITTLDEKLALLKDSVFLSKEEEDRIQRMKEDLETQQRELGEFRLSF